MPTGETPQPQFKRGEDLGYGQAQAANSLVGLLGPENPPEPHTPTGPEDSFIFGPTDRPDEPITSGAPFGPGAPGVKMPLEDDRSFMLRVTQQAATDTNAPGTLREFARRLEQGQ